MTGAANVLDVAVPAPDLGYPVMVEPGLLQRLGAELQRKQPRARRVALLSDETVMRHHGPTALASLRDAGFDVFEAAMSPGEVHKTPEQLLAWVSHLVRSGLGRDDVVVALGGGVVTDIAGLAAALFMRGIPFLSCPTSLLAQVDASVGGKVAVDLEQGKNLLGTFHFPRAVLIDPLVLNTLPDDELACGLAEMLKHGLLFSREHYEALQRQANDIFGRNPELLVSLIATSVGLKAACVARDPLEVAGDDSGRVLLNLGHTVGHALELVSDYALRHGEAVALGLRAAARVSHRRGLADASLEQSVVEALCALRLPTDLDGWISRHGEAIGGALANDKKRKVDSVTYIALRDIGEPTTLRLSSREILHLLQA